MMPMYHWASRRIEAHVKICVVLALLIERVAELACGKAHGTRSRGALDELQITEFFNLNFRVLMLNELPASTFNILKLLKITPPKQVIELEKTDLKTARFRRHTLNLVHSRGCPYVRPSRDFAFYKNQTQVKKICRTKLIKPW